VIAPVAVRVSDCACPHRNGSVPHPEGDEVYLRAKASLPLGLAVQGDIRSAAGDGTILAYAWKISYIRHGAVGWNRLDAKGQPVPFNPQDIIDDFEMGMTVAEKADELYGETVAIPFVQKLVETLLPGPTDDSTSPPPTSTPSPSEPSSDEPTAATTPSMP